MNPKAIHELSLRDLLNIGDKSKKFNTMVKSSIDKSDEKKLKKTRKNNIAQSTSIARATTGLVFTYPVLCSSSLDIKHCTMVSKALERKNVVMLQMLLAANQITDENIMDYLKNFHTNLDFNKMDIEDVIDTLSDPTVFRDVVVIPEALMEMMPLKEKNACLEDFRNNTNYFFKDDVNESSISRFKSLERNGYYTIIEGSDNDKKDDGIRIPDVPNDRSLSSVNGVDKVNKMTAPEINSNRLVSSDIKKANEMVPTLMLINTINPNTGLNVQSVIGVKSRLIIVPSNEIVGRIISHFENTNYLLKFIKLTTREISFVKDFLLAIDSAKLDAINNSKKGSASSLFKALERRAENGTVRKLANTEKQFAKAISSLVISQEDVENLKKYHNIDVEIARVIKPIMVKLNLLYFVIVDETSESIRIFVDGADDYEEYTFNDLEKESKDDSYKKVINLMTKMTK